jgi:MFS transporter, UMF1 family
MIMIACDGAPGRLCGVFERRMLSKDREIAGLLERCGLHRRELRAWAMYDWANSAFVLVIVTTVFPIFYRQVAAENLDDIKATALFTWTTTAALAIAAVLSPTLGTLADYLGWRKRMMGAFLALGASVTCCMYFIHAGEWMRALVLFGIANVAFSLTLVFYDSFLPHIASSNEIDRVSAAGYGLGYLGSGLLLVVNLWSIRSPASFGLADAETATRVSFVSAGLWWVLFSVSFFRRVVEPAAMARGTERGAVRALGVAFRRLLETLHELRGGHRQAFLMLVAFLIYNDGIGTIIRMAAIYASTRGLPQNSVMLAILLVQFVGVPCAFVFGGMGAWVGAKRAILIGLLVYIGISVVAYRMDTIGEFYLLAVLVALVQGGTQALSRSLFASMVPRHKATELFGFFAVFEKFAAIFGPMIFGFLLSVGGTPQRAILSVIAFFVVGGLLLTRVDVALGRLQAREAEAAWERRV